MLAIARMVEEVSGPLNPQLIRPWWRRTSEVTLLGYREYRHYSGRCSMGCLPKTMTSSTKKIAWIGEGQTLVMQVVLVLDFCLWKTLRILLGILNIAAGMKP